MVVASATITPDTLSTVFALLTGAAGLFFGFAYLRSPIWKLFVDVGDEAITVWNGVDVRMSLAWGEVERVVLDDERTTMFVDGGSPERSLLIPGPASPASYLVRRKDALIEDILARVDASLICTPEEARQLDAKAA